MWTRQGGVRLPAGTRGLLKGLFVGLLIWVVLGTEDVLDVKAQEEASSLPGVPQIEVVKDPRHSGVYIIRGEVHLATREVWDLDVVPVEPPGDPKTIEHRTMRAAKGELGTWDSRGREGRYRVRLYVYRDVRPHEPLQEISFSIPGRPQLKLTSAPGSQPVVFEADSVSRKTKFVCLVNGQPELVNPQVDWINGSTQARITCNIFFEELGLLEGRHSIRLTATNYAGEHASKSDSLDYVRPRFRLPIVSIGIVVVALALVLAGIYRFMPGLFRKDKAKDQGLGSRRRPPGEGVEGWPQGAGSGQTGPQGERMLPLVSQEADDLKRRLEQSTQEIDALRVENQTLTEERDRFQVTSMQASDRASALQLQVETLEADLKQARGQEEESFQARAELERNWRAEEASRKEEQKKVARIKENLAYLMYTGVPRLCDDVRLNSSVKSTGIAGPEGLGEILGRLGDLIIQLRLLERAAGREQVRKRVREIRSVQARDRFGRCLDELVSIASRVDEKMDHLFDVGPIKIEQIRGRELTNEFIAWTEDYFLPSLESGAAAKTDLYTGKIKGGGARELDGAWGRIERDLLDGTLSDFYVGCMMAQGIGRQETLAPELVDLDRRIQEILARVYRRKPQDIFLGKEYSVTEFDIGSEFRPIDGGGIRPGCICGVQKWGYTDLESRQIRERARVDKVAE